MNISWRETSGNLGASVKSRVQGRSRDGKAKQLMVGSVPSVEWCAEKEVAGRSLGSTALVQALKLLAHG